MALSKTLWLLPLARGLDGVRVSPETGEVVGQSEQEGLPHQHREPLPRHDIPHRAREHRENGLHQGVAVVHLPGRASTGGVHPHRLAPEAMVPLGVIAAVGPHHPEGCNVPPERRTLELASDERETLSTGQRLSPAPLDSGPGRRGENRPVDGSPVRWTVSPVSAVTQPTGLCHPVPPGPAGPTAQPPANPPDTALLRPRVYLIPADFYRASRAGIWVR